MSDTKKNVDLNKKDELIKQESAFVDLLSMEINKKIIGQKIHIFGTNQIFLQVGLEFYLLRRLTLD